MIRISKRTLCYLQYIILFLMYLREWCLVIGLDGITSPIYYASIVFLFLYLVLLLLSPSENENRMGILFKFFTVALIAILVYNIFFLTSEVYDATNTAIGRLIILLLLLCLMSNKVEANEQLFKFNNALNIVLALLMFFYSFMGASYNYAGQIIFGYSNPNNIGVSTYVLLVSLIYGFLHSSTWLNKSMNFFAILAAGYVLFLTRSRSAILSVLVLLILLFFYKKNKRINYKLISTLVILFVIIYPIVWYSVLESVGNRNIMFLGKPLFSDRELIWNYAFGKLFEAPFVTHLGESFKYGTGAHNVILDLWWDYGLIFAGLFIVFFHKFLNSMSNRISSLFDFYIYAAIISSCISMTLETTLFSGGVNFAFRLFYLGAFMSLSNRGEFDNG